MKLLIIALLVLTIGNVFSQNNKKKESQIDIKLSKCLKDSTTNSGMCNCTIQAEQAWDIELNKYYKLLLKELPSEAKEKLKISQRSWIDFRNKEFSFKSNYYYEVKQGTMFYMISDNSRMEFVKNRALDLEEYYNMLDY